MIIFQLTQGGMRARRLVTRQDVVDFRNEAKAHGDERAAEIAAKALRVYDEPRGGDGAASAALETVGDMIAEASARMNKRGADND